MTRLLHDTAVSRVLVCCALVVSVLAGCGTQDPPESAHIRDTTTLMPPRIASPGDPSCPRDGLWKPCALVSRMVRAGLVLTATGDSTRVAYLTPRGIQYRVGKSASMLAFFYPDTASATRAFLALDTIRLTPRGDTIGAWPSRPTVIRSANLLVALFDAGGTQAERIGLAITAGAPQAYMVPVVPILPIVPKP